MIDPGVGGGGSASLRARVEWAGGELTLSVGEIRAALGHQADTQVPQDVLEGNLDDAGMVAWPKLAAAMPTDEITLFLRSGGIGDLAPRERRAIPLVLNDERRDPAHPGHVAYVQELREMGRIVAPLIYEDERVVVLFPARWVTRPVLMSLTAYIFFAVLTRRALIALTDRRLLAASRRAATGGTPRVWLDAARETLSLARMEKDVVMPGGSLQFREAGSRALYREILVPKRYVADGHTVVDAIGKTSRR